MFTVPLYEQIDFEYDGINGNYESMASLVEFAR